MKFHFTFFSGVAYGKRLATIDSSKLFPSLYVSMSCFGHLSSCINLVKFPTLFYFLFSFFLCVFIAFHEGVLLNNLLIYFPCCICSIYIAMDFLLL